MCIILVSLDITHSMRRMFIFISYGLCNRCKIFVSRFQVYRANKMAMQKLEGSHAAQYGLLWNYCAAVRLYNPGSTMKLQVDEHKFQRLYACLDAAKRGLK